MEETATLFQRERFTSFGGNRFDPRPTPTVTHHLRARGRERLRQKVRDECPDLPGVYGMVNAGGELVYVGKSKRLRSRLLSYFSAKRHEKARRILESARTLVWESAPCEFAALMHELELIRRWRPRFNVQGQPGRKRRTYLCLGGAKAQYFYLSKKPAVTAQRFGPISSLHIGHEAVRRLNDWFKLRDCPETQKMVFADQEDLFSVARRFGCLRVDLGKCLGPCAAGCSRGEYAEATRAACDFLLGNNLEPLETLEKEMRQAAANLEFERAAVARDTLEPLRWVRDQLERPIWAQRRHHFVYRVPTADNAEIWYFLRAGTVRSAVLAPRDRPSATKVLAMLKAEYGQETEAPTTGLATLMEPVSLEQADALFLVAAWFRRHQDQLRWTMPVSKAMRHCRRIRRAAKQAPSEGDPSP